MTNLEIMTSQRTAESAWSDKESVLSCRLDRGKSLGWVHGPLDGLSCFQRYVEAILHARGYSSWQVAQIFVDPLDLLRRRGTTSQIGRCEVVWQSAQDGRVNWPILESKLANGQHVILRPDRYWWPGDRLNGKRHFSDFMYVAYELTDSVLHVLDTLAPEDENFVRLIPVDETVMRAMINIGIVEAPEPPARGDPQKIADDIFPESIPQLAHDIAAMRAWLPTWDTIPWDLARARSLHIAALGDFQPQLFIAASALAGSAPSLLAEARDACAQAAATARDLAFRFIALHKYEKAAMYRSCCRQMHAFVDSLESTLISLCRERGIAPPPPPEVGPEVFDARLATIRDIAL